MSLNIINIETIVEKHIKALNRGVFKLIGGQKSKFPSTKVI
jgi:hypothetical protein